MYGNVLRFQYARATRLRSSKCIPNIRTTRPKPHHGSSNPVLIPFFRDGNNFYIAAQGRNSVILMHTPETNLNNMQPRDLAPITYTFRVRQQGAGGLTSQLVTVTQYPSLYIQNEESARRGGVVSTGFPYYNYYQP